MGLCDIFDIQAGLEPINLDYNVDIIMCIDATGSMDPILDEVKRKALSFGEIFREAMNANGKEVHQLRVKVIVFRDYIIDSEPMVESRFFKLPEEKTQFNSFVGKIEASGGGDEPENALEAISAALGSDWVTSGAKRRHVILLFTDASAHPLGERKSCPGYPNNIPTNISALNAWWEGVSQYHYSNYQANNGRMVLFVPRKEPWTQMGGWSRLWISYSDRCGLEGTGMDDVIGLLVGSVQ